MRTLALQSTLVAALALGALGDPPVADQAQTNSQAPINIPVLLNDPGGTRLLGIGDGGAPVSTFMIPGSGATVSVAGNQISYSPNGFTGNDNFTYLTDCGDGTPVQSATVVVAVTPGVAAGGALDVSAPRPDFATTTPATCVEIDVLSNDPENSVITAIQETSSSTPVPISGGAAVTLSIGTVTMLPPTNDNMPMGEQGTGSFTLQFCPDAGVTGTITFSYTTQGGMARVTVSISTTNAPPLAGPRDQTYTTDVDTPIIIPILEANPVGTLLLGVNDFVINNETGNLDRTLGRVEIRGNTVLYTPNTQLQSNSSPPDRFTYETNTGTGVITIMFSTGGGQVLARINLSNMSSFPVAFTITGPTQSSFVDCIDSIPYGAIQVASGQTVMTVPPFTGTPDLCVALPLGVAAGDIFLQATTTGTGGGTNACGTPVPSSFATSSSPVNVSATSTTTVTIIDLNETCIIGTNVIMSPIGIRFQ